jgi:nicotinamide-nucleotide amidase
MWRAQEGPARDPPPSPAPPGGVPCSGSRRFQPFAHRRVPPDLNSYLLAIGDEIVTGATVDTNSSYLAGRLVEAGAEVRGISAVPDDVAAISAALGRALDAAELVVTTGGLGPTADDLTTEAVAAVAGVERTLHEPSLAAITERFAAAGREMTPNNRRQAMLPRGCTVLPNAHGTAPGFVCSVERPGGARFVASLPGVPSEMEHMAEEALLPWLAARGRERSVATRVFTTFGLSESKLDALLDQLLPPGEGRLAFRAAFPRIQARVTLAGAGDGPLAARLDELEAEVRRRLGAHLLAAEDVGMEEVVARLLLEAGHTLALAESCTGGLIGHRLTEVPGASSFLAGGVVAYADSAKRELLGVGADTLRAHGAVSEETAREMAEGARTRTGTTLGLSVTGIAGPGGGSAAKPVGTVCIAVAWEGDAWSRRYQLGAHRGRGWIKVMSSELALDAVRRRLLGTLEREDDA